jgi:hypothetical protein
MHGTAPEGAVDGLSHHKWKSTESGVIPEQALGCVVGAAHEAFNLCAGLFKCAAFALKAIAVSASDPKHQCVAKHSRLGSAFFWPAKFLTSKNAANVSRRILMSRDFYSFHMGIPENDKRKKIETGEKPVAIDCSFAARNII